MCGNENEVLLAALSLEPPSCLTLSGDRVITPRYVLAELEGHLAPIDVNDAAVLLNCTVQYITQTVLRHHSNTTIEMRGNELIVRGRSDDDDVDDGDCALGPDEKEALQLVLDGYLWGCTRPASLAQCVAAMPSSLGGSDGVKDLVIQATRKVGGTFRDYTYFPPVFLSSQEDEAKATLLATGYLPSLSSLDLANPSVQRALTSESLVFIPSATEGRVFACACRVLDALSAALLQLSGLTDNDGDGEGCWWLHAPVLLPPAAADHPGDTAALLLHCVSKAGGPLAFATLGGQFAAKTSAVAALRVCVLGSLSSYPAKAKVPSKQVAVEAMLQHLGGRRAEDHDLLVTLLGLLWDEQLYAVVQMAVAAAEERVKRRRLLTLGPMQAEKPQREAERDDIFSRHWSLLHLALKATQYIGKDGGEAVAADPSWHDGAVARCAVLAALLTVFACWENNVAPPLSLTGRFAVRHTDGTLAFDFDSCLGVAPTFGTSGAPLVPPTAELFGREERKRVLIELPKGAAVAIVALWESVEMSEAQRTPAPFVEYVEENKHAFRAITTRPDKKAEKVCVGRLQAEVLASLQLVAGGASSPPSVSSVLVALADISIASAAVRRQLQSYALALAYIDVTGGTRGAVMPVPTIAPHVLLPLAEWLGARDEQLAPALSKLMLTAS